MGSFSLLQGDLPNLGMDPRSPSLHTDCLLAKPPGKPKNTRVGSLSLLQGIFPTQEWNQGLLYYRWILYQLSHQGSPTLEAQALRRGAGISPQVLWGASCSSLDLCSARPQGRYPSQPFHPPSPPSAALAHIEGHLSSEAPPGSWFWSLPTALTTTPAFPTCPLPQHPLLPSQWPGPLRSQHSFLHRPLPSASWTRK